ncbi:MAG: hypothetical protein UHM85_05760 [Acutalibacteraceae bacterium]|nr:hypothetical protein [Acutalibacteraceae bacterium]
MNIKEFFNEIPKEIKQGISIALVIIVLFTSGNLVGLVVRGDKSTDAAATTQTVTEATTQSTTAPTTAPTQAPTQAPATTTAAPSGDTSTTAPSADATTTTAAPSTGAPTSKEDIVKLYCEAYNKVSEASSVTRTYDYTSNYNNIVNVNGNEKLKDLAGTLMTKFMVENTEAVASDHASLPPVGSTTLNIDPSLISNATCTDNGDHYLVTLYSTGTDDNYEIDSQPGTGSAGSIGPLLRAEDVTGAAGSIVQFEGLHSWYATAQVTAKIDKATSRITEIEYKTPCILHFDRVKALVVVSIENCEIGLLFNQKYTIAY